MTARLTDFKVLVFDVYGTLADWETGILLGLKPMLSRYSTSSGWSRKQVLEAFSAVESDLQAKYPHLLYSDLLAKVHEVMEERLKAGSGLPVETSTVDGDPSSLPISSSSSNQGFYRLFSGDLLASRIGRILSYKPALHGFEVALDVIHREAALLNTPKDQVLWVAQSLFHDIEPDQSRFMHGNFSMIVFLVKEWTCWLKAALRTKRNGVPSH
ncbi:HAD-like protein [Lentinula edodes]|uniref:HAD-like protein n=1 Tax=Lentinula edodes TaxID=5353 RepID=A0A1Q3ECI2_LENED|nr:HAD-like protein [Lentinula edodes]